MKKALLYIGIPLVMVGVSALGSSFTSTGLQGWYSSLSLPGFTPPGGVIGLVWTTIYILTAISAILFYREHKDNKVTLALASNLLLNISWSYIFFTAHLVGLAVLWAGFLGLSVLALIVLMWKKARVSALLLVPYLAWVSFATYLNYVIYTLN